MSLPSRSVLYSNTIYKVRHLLLLCLQISPLFWMLKEDVNCTEQTTQAHGLSPAPLTMTTALIPLLHGCITGIALEKPHHGEVHRFQHI